MEDRKFIISSSPHQRCELDTPHIMYHVILALVPAVVMSVIYFGLSALILMVVSMLTAVLTEALLMKYVLKKDNPVMDGSAALTGLLLAMCVTPELPVWTMVIGSAFAVGIGKVVYGGLGNNIFNPAHIGRAFLLAAYPVYMTTWRWPEIGNAGIDAMTTATPLALLKVEGIATPVWNLFIGNTAGSLGETCAAALIIGGIYLLVKKIIDWRIPVAYLGTVFLLSAVMGENPFFHIFAGGLMIGAFFMATDYVTSPVTRKGRIIFGVGCGLLTVLIRNFGGYPEGVCYSILLMNAVTPLIDRWTVPKRYGEVKKT